MTKEELEKKLGYTLTSNKYEEICNLEYIPLTHIRTNLTGQKFNRLYVLGRAPSDTKGKRPVTKWWCICDCKNHSIISVRVNNLTSNNTKSCGCLEKEKSTERIIAIGKAQAKNLTGQTCGLLTALYPTEERKNGSVVWICQCNNCGRKNVKITASEFGRQTQMSCGCIKESKGMYYIKKILQENNIEYITEKAFLTCKFPDTNIVARFDFYLPKYNILIEYDGEQHYKELDKKFFSDSLEKRQYHDNFKNQWCKNNNIPLVRIPYWITSSITIEDLLSSESKYRI